MLNKAFVVGLTGPMGSGKTVVASLFESSGYAVIDADTLARKVVEKGSATLLKLSDRFGKDIIKTDGTLDRKLLSLRAFSCALDTADLNSITHPAIIELVKAEIHSFCSQGYTKIVYDAPLLFESESDKLCDIVVCVVADLDDRMDRVKKRDALSFDEIKRRFKAQHTNDFYIDRSDYVIYNNGSPEKLSQDTFRVISALNEVNNGTFCKDR